MARFLNSKSMAGFLLIFLGLFVSNTWAAATVEGAKLKSVFEGKATCSSDSDCYLFEHCYMNNCITCDFGETWDSTLGKCRDSCNGIYDHWDGSKCITCEWDEYYDIVDRKCKDDLDLDDEIDDIDLSMIIIVVVGVVLPVIITASICACCCCCAGCAGHAYRQRRNNNNQMQPQTVFVQQHHPGYPGQYGNNGPPYAQAQPPAYSPPNHGLYPQQKY